MASLTSNSSKQGFATPAATIVTLALATIATAAMGAAVGQLRLSKAEFEQTRVEEELIGAQERAALTLLGAGGAARYRWSSPGGNGQIVTLAEPEAAKLGLAAAAALDDNAYSQLGVQDAGDLKARLSALTARQALGPDLEEADAAPLWRACARSLVSAFGLSKALQLPLAQDPDRQDLHLHVAEVWRIRAASPEGWADDRIVRFTGNALHPTAVLARRFMRLGREDDRCETLLKASS